MWLRENDCPWNNWTCILAATNGHLKCLKYAVENGCSIEREECLEDAKTQEIKDYLLSLEN